MDYDALQEFNDERDRLQAEQARMEAETEAFGDGREGRRPSRFDLDYLNAWGRGFAALVQEREQIGWLPVLEWRPRSYVAQMHCQVTDPSYGD